MVAETASKAAIDFTNVRDGGVMFNKHRQPEGDYKAKVMKVVDAPSKKDGVPQWLFTIQVGTGLYPFYCKQSEEQYWKIRNLLAAAGMNVPKKKVMVDPNKIVGKLIGVTLQDDEYNGKAQSTVAATFPVSELEETVASNGDDGDDEDEEEEPAPKPAKAKAKAPVVEDEDDDEEEAPPPKAKKKAPVIEDDDDLEEIDIDDT